MTLYPSSDAVTPPARHAALLLHALSPVDRTWALGQLPPPQRTQLAALIQELQELGIPRDRSLVDQAVASLTDASAAQPAAPVTHAEGTHPGSRQLLERLDAEGCRELGRLLRHEPAALVAQLLAREDWPWANELLNHLGPVKRRQVEMLLGQPEAHSGAASMSAAIVDTVVAHLHAALQQMPDRQRSAPTSALPTGSKARWHHRLMSAFRRPGAAA